MSSGISPCHYGVRALVAVAHTTTGQTLVAFFSYPGPCLHLLSQSALWEPSASAQEEEVLQHPGAHLGIMRMKAPPRRKFLLRLSKQLGDTAWQKSVPPLSPWGGGLGGDGCARVCVGVACSCVFIYLFIFLLV